MVASQLVENSSEVALIYNPAANRGKASKDIIPVIESLKRLYGRNIHILATKQIGDGINW